MPLVKRPGLKHFSLVFKRALDVAVAVCGIVLLSPVFIFVGLVVRIVVGAPVLFRQERPGLNSGIFTLYKFRTMTNEHDLSGSLRTDEERLGRLGKLLRRTSLDELPELWNVLRGDMSLVGPRPLLVGYLPLYSREQARRHEMRPGLTGIAQVSGRNELDWTDRFRLDVWYVDHWTLWLDFRILASTVAKVVGMKGISGGGRATMEPFRGCAPTSYSRTEEGELLGENVLSDARSEDIQK